MSLTVGYTVYLNYYTGTLNAEISVIFLTRLMFCIKIYNIQQLDTFSIFKKVQMWVIL